MHQDVARVFVGFDRRFPVAYHVLVQSILERSSIPVAFAPLALNTLGSAFNRTPDPLQSTEFAFSRFLTPHLSGYAGWSLFLDNDMVMLADLKRLWDLRDDRYAVMCVQHDYAPRGETKFLGARQTAYPKKNWSSLMLFNNARCRALTPDYVNAASGLELHQFKWLGDDGLIGALPPEWNTLVGYQDDVAAPACLHFTDGGPFYPDYADAPRAEAWFAAFERANDATEADAVRLAATAAAKRKV